MLDKKTIINYAFWLAFCIVGGMFGAWSYNVTMDRYTNNLNGPNMTANINQTPILITSDSKQVVVEQDNKIIDNIYAIDRVLVGLFQVNKNGEYNLAKPNAQALVLTSDGWLMTNFNSPDKNWYNNFVVIDSFGKLYKIDNAVTDVETNFVFIQLEKAQEMNVASFVKARDLRRGQTVLTVNWLGQANPNSIALTDDRPYEIKSSDKLLKRLKMLTSLEWQGQIALIDLRGRVAGIFDKQGGVLATDYFVWKINNLFAKDKLAMPYLGVYYINKSWQYSDELYIKGAQLVRSGDKPAVIKGSPADKAGLVEGDIILALDDLAISRDLDLTDLISDYKPGSRINVKIIRDGRERNVNVELGGK